MKTATFLIVFLFTTPIFAQRGYCPCMEKEKKNQGIDLYELLKIDNQTVELNTVAEDPPAVQMLLISQRPNPVLPPSPEPVQQVQEALQIQQVQQVAPVPESSKELDQKESIQSESSAKRFKKSKSKKRKRVRLRARKKAKRYRGKCPKFSY